MANELTYVLINPYTIAKSRTGGVLARYIGRSDLRFVAARLFGPSEEMARRYAELLRRASPEQSDTRQLLADYVERNYVPNPMNGRPRRVMMLLFEGEDAIRRIWEMTGSATLRAGSGETVRDTFGDYVLDADGSVRYFEPAVLAPSNATRAAATLRLWSEYSETCGGLITSATDIPEGSNVQTTLVMLKPDNFRFPSLRAGNIVDILSASGLRIIGVKKFAMTVEQAESFYGPVREALSRKFVDIGAERAASALTREFGFNVRVENVQDLCRAIAPAFAEAQFDSIVQYMTGFKPSECKAEDKSRAGSEECVALVYEGPDAVAKIRSILGPTDPSKAKPGSVRREFGSTIMMNAAHASDSPENAEREMRIIRVEEDTIARWVDRFYPRSTSR